MVFVFKHFRKTSVLSPGKSPSAVVDLDRSWLRPSGSGRLPWCDSPGVLRHFLQVVRPFARTHFWTRFQSQKLRKTQHAVSEKSSSYRLTIFFSCSGPLQERYSGGLQCLLDIAWRPDQWPVYRRLKNPRDDRNRTFGAFSEPERKKKNRIKRTWLKWRIMQLQHFSILVVSLYVREQLHPPAPGTPCLWWYVSRLSPWDALSVGASPAPPCCAAAVSPRPSRPALLLERWGRKTSGAELGTWNHFGGARWQWLSTKSFNFGIWKKIIIKKLWHLVATTNSVLSPLEKLWFLNRNTPGVFLTFNAPSGAERIGESSSTVTSNKRLKPAPHFLRHILGATWASGHKTQEELPDLNME